MSQRKSVGRRRSRSLCGLNAKDFCETIPKDLPESERLLKLVEMSFRYALKESIKHAKVEENFDSSSFFAKGEECLENAKVAIAEKNLHKLAVENDKQDECHEESHWHKDIKLLEAESEKWSSVMSAYRANLENETLKVNASYCIDASTVEKNKDYNYDDIMKETSALDRKLSSKISGLSSASLGIKTALTLSKFAEAKLKRDCEKYYHQEVSNTPRTMLKRMISPRR